MKTGACLFTDKPLSLVGLLVIEIARLKGHRAKNQIRPRPS